MNNEAEKNEPLSMETLRARLEHNQRYYSEKDPANRTLSVFADAALSALERMPFFRQNLEDMIALRPDLKPSHAVKLIERSYQAVFLKEDPGYPYNYRTVPVLHEAFEAIEHDDASAEMLHFRLLTQRVQSNIAERYKTVKLLAHTYKDRFGTEPSHLDIGSSVLQGSLKLAFNRAHYPRRVPFGDIQINKMDRSEKTEKDNTATRLANIALRSEVSFGPMMGIDITNVDDRAIKEWAKSCSFYPDELLDLEKVKEYDELDNLDPDHERVRFARVDFSDTRDVRRLRAVTNNERYDIITFSTIFYQVNLRERQAMLVNAAQFLSDEGVILIQDAPDGNFETPYNYRASVIDGTAPELGEQELLRWKTPRCKEAIIGLGKVSIHGKLTSFDDALEEMADSI